MMDPNGTTVAYRCEFVALISENGSFIARLVTTIYYNILKSHMQGNLPKRKSPLLQLNLYNKMQCFPEHPEQQCTFLGKK